jgi:HEAT repeat protein
MVLMKIRAIVLSLAMLSGLFRASNASAASAIDKKSRDIIEAALEDKSPDTRREAVLSLSLVPQTEPLFEKLESSLFGEKDVLVRLAAVSSLTEIKSSRSIRALKKALDDDVPEISFAAAKALLTLNDPSGKAALLSVLSGDTKTSSSFFTKQKRDAMRMMQTPKGMFIFALRTGIGFVPVPGMGQGFASMQGILSDPSVSGRATAALLLGRERDAKTLDALKDALTDKDWSVRAAAVHSLALRGDPKLRKDLEPLLDDEKEAVRLRAAASMLRLGRVSARPSPAASPRSAPAKQN